MYQLDSKKNWPDPKVPVQFEFRNPQTPFPMHIHDFHELVLVYSGKATHLTTAGDRDIQSGDLVSVKPDQAHGYKNIKNLILMNIHIKPEFFEDVHSLKLLPAFETMFGQETETDTAPVIQFRLSYGIFSKAKELVENANVELSSRSDGYKAMVLSLIQEFIVLLLRSKKEQTRSGFALNTTTLFDYVRHNYKSPLCMGDLTSISGMSESNVLRAFKQYMSCSPFQYISKLRLEAAQDALIQTDRSITDIAHELGFNDSNYFTRLFRKYFSFSPREYRKKYLVENLL